MIIKLRRSNFLVLILVHSFVSSGQTSFNESYRFLNHLGEIGSLEEGVHYVNRNLNTYSLPGQLDTLNYLKGYFLYQLRQPQESINALSNVGNSNPRFKMHSTFLNAFQRAYLGDFSGGQSALDSISTEDGLMQDLKIHELAGISLLRRDLETFEMYSNQYTGEHFQLSTYRDQLRTNRDGLLKARKKSPFLAGLLSGIVPGAGKFYVGKVGEGYTTLLLSTILGLQMREAYKKDGVSSFRFKLFTGLFSTLYVANIWGSVLSVKIYKDDFNDTFNEAILLNMHVPLRTIFD